MCQKQVIEVPAKEEIPPPPVSNCAGAAEGEIPIAEPPIETDTKPTAPLPAEKPSSVPEPKNVYKAVVVGGGPAGIGVVLRATRIGYLEKLLDRDTASNRLGIAMVHDGPVASLGAGKLGNYVINSNTFAKSMVTSVLEDRLDLEPPEKVTGTFLEELREHSTAQVLNDYGHVASPLADIGKFLSAVGEKVGQEIEKHEDSRLLLNTKVVKVQMLESGIVRVVCRKPMVQTNGTLVEKETVLHTQRVIFATGGSQAIPNLGNSAHQKKLFVSDKVLQKDGWRELHQHIQSSSKGQKVCIVGGSHSAFSVGCLLLNKLGNSDIEKQKGAQAKPSKLQPINFQVRDITLIHRSPIQCYYHSRKEAEADGLPSSILTDRSGAVNTFTGLREDAKRLYKSIQSGAEQRIRLFQVKAGGSTQIQTKSFDSACAIVWCCGYATNMPSVVDDKDNPIILRQKSGQVSVDTKARLQIMKKGQCGQLLGIGLGFGLKAPVQEVGGETRSDGAAVYQRRGASLVLGQIFGECIYGEGCSTYEEMVENQEKTKKALVQKEQQQKIAATQHDSINRLAVSGTSAVATVKCPSPKKQASVKMKPQDRALKKQKSQDGHIRRVREARESNSPSKYNCPYCGCEKAFGPTCKSQKSKLPDPSTIDEDEEKEQPGASAGTSKRPSSNGPTALREEINQARLQSSVNSGASSSRDAALDATPAGATNLPKEKDPVTEAHAEENTGDKLEVATATEKKGILRQRKSIIKSNNVNVVRELRTSAVVPIVFPNESSSTSRSKDSD